MNLIHFSIRKLIWTNFHVRWLTWYRNPALHGKAIRCVRNLMTSHDFDSRYYERESRARFAVLYLPLLGIVMDAIPQLHAYLQESHDNIGFLDDYQGPQHCKNKLLIEHFPIELNFHNLIFLAVTTTTISSEVAYAISGSRLFSPFSPETSKNKAQLSSENTRHLLSCYLWILKNLDRSVLHRWILSSTPHRVYQMLQVNQEGKKQTKIFWNIIWFFFHVCL